MRIGHVEVDRLPQRMLIGKVDKTHPNHQDEQVPRVIRCRDLTSALGRFEDGAELMQNGGLRQEPRMAGQETAFVEILPEEKFHELAVCRQEMKMPLHDLADHGCSGC